MANGRVSINVSVAASRHDLREDLDRVARSRGSNLSRLVRDILHFAVRNKELYEEPLQNPRERGGKHISTQVSPALRKRLNEWADERTTQRSNLVAFVLEKTLEADIIGRVYESIAIADDDEEDTED